jgi:hypothetical protein
MSNAEHNEWLIQEKERLEAEKKKRQSIESQLIPDSIERKKKDKSEKPETQKEDDDVETSGSKKWTQSTDDDEYYL